MNEQSKPNFAVWQCDALAKISHDLWDDNLKLREANEQLRLNNRDLSETLRRKFMMEDDGK